MLSPTTRTRPLGRQRFIVGVAQGSVFATMDTPLQSCTTSRDALCSPALSARAIVIAVSDIARHRTTSWAWIRGNRGLSAPGRRAVDVRLRPDADRWRSRQRLRATISAKTFLGARRLYRLQLRDWQCAGKRSSQPTISCLANSWERIAADTWLVFAAQAGESACPGSRSNRCWIPRAATASSWRIRPGCAPLWGPGR